jgi:hypothetical protein
MNPTDGMAAKIAPGDQHLHTILENLGRVGDRRNSGGPGDPLGITHRETSEREAIYHRLVTIESEMKRRGSRGFARYLVAICIGVAATLAWQSYGDAIKQIIAAEAPELGWSPQAKQMIASWTLGWTKPPAGPEKIASENVAPKAPRAPSLDPAQVQQITQSLAAVRETLQELAGGQESMARDIARLESAVASILLKIPEPPPQSPAAPAGKPPASPSSSRVPTPPPSSRSPIPRQ